MKVIVFSCIILFCISCAKSVSKAQDYPEQDKNIGNITYEVKTNETSCIAEYLVGENYQTSQVTSNWTFPFNHGQIDDSVSLTINPIDSNSYLIGSVYFKGERIYSDTSIGQALIIKGIIY